jgi:hypothetical protein
VAGGLSGVIAVAAGSGHSLALKGDGTVWAWGSNSSGELGNRSSTDSWIPVQALLPCPGAEIAGGWASSLARCADGTVWEWGFGAGGNPSSNVPVRVSGPAAVASIGTGNRHSVVANGDGTVLAWGENEYGQLGDGTPFIWYQPAAVTLDAVPPSQGNMLRAIKKTGGVVGLDLTGAPASMWRLYRDAVKTAIGASPLTPGSDTTSPATGVAYYAARGLSACTMNEGPFIRR